MANQCNTPTEIPNMDLCYAAASLRNWYISIMKSQSADQADGFPIEADMIRLKDRVGDLKVKWDHINEQPFLDCPEAQGCVVYAYPQLDELAIPENDDIIHIGNMIKLMHFEWGSSQSARMANGLQKFDYDRGVAFLGKVSSLIDNYITDRTPNDWPEASPEQAPVGPGRTGV